MGGGVSQLGTLSRSDLERICEGQEPQKIESVWNSLKGPDDTIDSSYFLHIADDDAEKEALSLYICFGGGVMSKDLFIDFCLHAKLLSKRKFDRATAEIIFDQNCKDGISELNYIPVRFEIFPVIAKAHGKYVRDIIRRLSCLDEPLPRMEGPGTTNQNNPQNSDRDCAAQRAVLCIQKLVRAKRAAWQLRQLQELRTMEEQGALEEREQQELEENLNMCKKLFDQFSPSGQMDMRDFIRLCYDTELIPYGTQKVDFTSGDAKFVFKKVAAKYFDPTDRVYKNGVIFGKRFIFKVFRDSVIPELAAAKNISLDEMILFLASSTGIRRMNGQWDSGVGPTVIATLSSSFLDEHIQSNQYENEVGGSAN